MSQRPLHSPLNDTHLEQIRRIEPNLDSVKAQLELAKRAGIDVAALEAQHTKHADTLKRIKQTYFPGE